MVVAAKNLRNLTGCCKAANMIHSSGQCRRTGRMLICDLYYTAPAAGTIYGSIFMYMLYHENCFVILIITACNEGDV